MTESKTIKVLMRLQDDLRAVYGTRIPIEVLATMLGFGSAETLRQALKGSLTLTLHHDPIEAQPYVSVVQLLELLKLEYKRAVWHINHPKAAEEVKMDK